MICNFSLTYTVVGVVINPCKICLFILLVVNNFLYTKTDSKKNDNPLFEETSDSEDEKIEPIHFDKDYNIIIRVLIKRGNCSKVLDVSTDRVDLTIQAPDYEEALEAEVCRFLSNLLQVRREAISVIEKQEEGDTMKKILLVDGKLIGGAMVWDRIIEAIDDETFIKQIKKEEEELSHSLQLLDS